MDGLKRARNLEPQEFCFTTIQKSFMTYFNNKVNAFWGRSDFIEEIAFMQVWIPGSKSTNQSGIILDHRQGHETFAILTV